MNATYKRRLILTAALSALIVLVTGSVVYAHMEKSSLKVSIDGLPINGEVFYHTELNRTFVPADAIAKALGGNATYDEDAKTINVKIGDNQFQSVIGEKKVVVNGLVLPADSGARLVEDAPVLPLRLLVEMLGGKVTWDENSKTVAVASPLQVELLSPGHWHVYKEKKLTFKVINMATGAPVKNLEVAVRMTGLNGWTRANSVTGGTVVDNGDGTYTTSFTPMEMGSEYSHPYVITVDLPYVGYSMGKSWAVETTRDGPEGIIKEGMNGKTHAYQVRYGWQGGDIYADDTKEVTMLFEPMKSVQEGDEINRAQPFRNTFSHIPDLEAKVVIKSDDGNIMDEIAATYKGKGVYTASRLFSKAEAAAGGDYIVSFVFTDPDTGAIIDTEDNQLAISVLPIASASPPPVKQESTVTARLDDGKRFFEGNCASCHALPDQMKIRSYQEDTELQQMVNNMGKMSGLTQIDIDKIFDYLSSLRR